jgi:hypothetical protein
VKFPQGTPYGPPHDDGFSDVRPVSAYGYTKLLQRLPRGTGAAVSFRKDAWWPDGTFWCLLSQSLHLRCIVHGFLPNRYLEVCVKPISKPVTIWC